MRRTSLNAANCPVARTLDVIGDWWSLLIVRDACRGLRRFGEFQKSLGMARNILTTRLRGLVADGILEIRPAGGRHAYELTEKGRALVPVLLALREWGTAYFPDGGPWGSEWIDLRTGDPIRGLSIIAEDGRPVPPDSVAVRPAVTG